MRGCVILSQENGSKYVSDEFRVVPQEIIEDSIFIRVRNIKDIYNCCKPMLEYVRNHISKDRYLYMVELQGIAYLDMNMYPRDKDTAWLMKCDDYREEVEHLNEAVQ